MTKPLKPVPTAAPSPAGTDVVIGGAVANDAPLAPTISEPQFFYSHQAGAYRVLAGKVVPDLGKYFAVPGVNGIDADKNGNFMLGGFKVNMEAAGKRIIPHNVDAPEHPSYCRRYGRGHVDRFTRVYAGSDATQRDNKAFAEWCLSLMKRGICYQYTAPDLRRMIALRERMLDSVALRGLTRTPNDERQTTIFKAELVIIRKALAELEPEVIDAADGEDAVLA
jgi:hypothetical protein